MMRHSPFEAAALLGWYRRHRREMPWRGHPSPYAVWVSEIMLQQTQVDTVRPYFERFMRRLPTLRALAEAETGVVLKLWEGLGYYARARNLQRAAQTIMREHGGRLPETASGLAGLPGIGDYTAAAIASICFGVRVPVVDGNVARVFARFFLLSDDFRRPAPRRVLADRLQPAFEGVDSPGDLNQAMMELGAMICHPLRPECPVCPLADACRAKRTNRQEAVPVQRKKQPQPVREAVAVVVRRGSMWLMTQRGENGLLGGLWELPGGEIAADESVESAARHRVRERTGLDIAVTSTVGEVRHVFSHFILKLVVVEARRVCGRIRRGPDRDIRWVSGQTLETLPVATAHRRAIAKIAKMPNTRVDTVGQKRYPVSNSVTVRRVVQCRHRDLFSTSSFRA